MNDVSQSRIDDLLSKDGLDCLEEKLRQYPQQDCPVKHTFTPGLYSRQITMPANSLILSETHGTRHQFVILQGSIIVIIDGKKEMLQAPYSGITEPGTRRLLYVLEDCIFTTFHPTNIKPKSDSKEDVELAVEKIGRKILVHNPQWDETGVGMGNIQLRLNTKHK